MGAQMEQFETPKDHPNFNSLHYKTPLLKFWPKTQIKLRRFEKKYEQRVKRISKRAHDEFNSLFPQSSGKKNAQMLHIQEYSDNSGGIFCGEDSIQHSLINTSKILKTINLLEGRSKNKIKMIKPLNQYQRAIESKSRQLGHEKSMSNIYEGAELSTGRQEEEENQDDTNHPMTSSKKANPNEYITTMVNGELVKRKEKTVWKKVVKFMKKNPDILMELINDNNHQNYQYATVPKMNEQSPYVGTSSDTATIPTQYAESKWECLTLRQHKIDEIQSDEWFKPQEYLLQCSRDSFEPYFKTKNEGKDTWVES